MVVSPPFLASGSVLAIILALITAAFLTAADFMPLQTEMDVKNTASAAIPKANEMGGPYTRVDALDDDDSA